MLYTKKTEVVNAGSHTATYISKEMSGVDHQSLLLFISYPIR